MSGPAVWLAVFALLGATDEVGRLTDEAFRLAPSDESAALVASDRALELAPDDPRALRAGLFVRLRLRDLEGARRLGDRAVGAAPDDPWIRIWVGNVAFWRGAFDDARSRYREAAEIGKGTAVEADAREKLARLDEEARYRTRAASIRRRGILVGALALAALLGGSVALVVAHARGGGAPAVRA